MNSLQRVTLRSLDDINSSEYQFMEDAGFVLEYRGKMSRNFEEYFEVCWLRDESSASSQTQ